MAARKHEEPRKRDWRISATLLAVWVAALFALGGRETEIPLSMLAIASLFFVLLIPAMNDLVSSMDRFFGGRGKAQEPDELEGH
jgi:hypothetical protein